MDTNVLMLGSDGGESALPLELKARGAVLGAAVGDALGWPQERPSLRPTDSVAHGQDNLVSFIAWVRTVGGPYLAHDEPVRPGEYSDDTQLIISTARSLLRGSTWWEDFAYRELPFWLLVERGGGGATKRAVRSWCHRKPPWEQTKESELQSYFQAGGNGVAMRILPHCVRATRDNDFTLLARSIVANGVCTHGHPRALVGALAYGYILWIAFRHIGTLAYGELIDQALNQVNTWALLPNISSCWPTWLDCARRAEPRYDDVWRSVIDEMIVLLETAMRGISQGALPVDRQVLNSMQAFDGKINGAGTISAAAAVFLASRYATDPVLGLLEAAFSTGADTDTLASMTGGVLGALSGTDWIVQYRKDLQDVDYLEGLARDLARDHPLQHPMYDPRLSTTMSSSLDGVKQQLASAEIGKAASLPDGTLVKVIGRETLPTKQRGTAAVLLRLESDQRQTVYIKLFDRSEAAQESARARQPTVPTAQTEHPDSLLTSVVGFGIRLPVRDLARSRHFYEHVLRLPVVREEDGAVRFPAGFAICSATHVSSTVDPVVIFIEARDVGAVYSAALKLHATVERPLAEGKARRSFRCVDPDGNLVEIFERKQQSMQSDKEASSLTPASDRTRLVEYDDTTRARPRGLERTATGARSKRTRSKTSRNVPQSSRLPMDPVNDVGET